MRLENETLGQQVRRYREARGWTRKELAHQIGCAVVTLQKVERDERRPSVELLQLLTQALQLKPGETAGLTAMRHVDSTKPTSTQRTPGSIIGRTAELQQIKALLTTGQARLLTLTGPGGVGKTCLAMAAVSALEVYFCDGAIHVELAALQHPALVAHTIARAVGLTDSSEETLEQRLFTFLQAKQLLLYLDNVEQLRGAFPLFEHLLAACPTLVMLITSREALRLSGETVVTVRPLAVPTEPALSHNPLAGALASPAVTLFVQRAQAANPNFLLTAENASAIAQLCMHLDGLPLAIELVAARSRLLPPAALLRRVVTATGQLRLGLLAQEEATLPTSTPARHRTLRETLDWSYQLLTPVEQDAFRRFALFAGGCTLAAAEALLPAEEEADENAAVYVWDLLSSLLDKSLLYQREQQGEVRFFMLETIREYAREALLQQTEGEAYQRRYAYYYGDVAQRCFDQLVEGVDADHWLAVADQEQPNLRNALAWAVRHDDGEIAVRMATALWRYWWIRGQWQEGRSWLETALPRFTVETAAAQRLRARALRSLGGLCVAQGDHRAARTALEQSLALARGVEDEYVESLALSSLATLCCHEGEYVEAETLLLQSMVYDTKTNNERDLAVSYGMLGEIGLYQADYPKAERYLRQALQRQQARNDQHSLLLTQLNLGEALVGQMHYAAAQPYLEEGLRLARSVGNPLAEATALQQLAELSFALEQPECAFPLLLAAFQCAEEHALHQITSILLRILGEQMIKQGELTVGVRLLGGCQAVAKQHGIVLAATEQSRLDHLLAQLWTAQAQYRIEAAYQTGQATPLAMTLSEARRLCTQTAPAP